MPFERPTFSESWHRVADLRPRLRADVQVVRQRFRGRTWWVLRDGATTEYHRVDENGYRFLGLLDGRRTVDEAWNACAALHSETTLTQPEALDLIGRLSSAHLLSGDGGAGAPSLLLRRQRRMESETRSTLQNFLFVRIPIFDPDALLDRWSSLVGWVFTPVGGALMVGVWLAGAMALFSSRAEIKTLYAGALTPDNLPLLYLTFVMIKAVHELAHGFACKAYGSRYGGGEVHTIGVMLLVFFPVPYVDASSSWSFPRRRPRIVVAAAGLFAELTIAAVALIVWAATNEGVIHSLASNAVLIAGVSSLLFNGNPLLRYDGYYILSDTVDIPNLWNRSREHVLYLIKSYAFGVRGLTSPAHDANERVWMIAYFLASLVYRVVLYSTIVWFLADRFFTIGLALAIGAIISFAALPFARGVRYLLASPELGRQRPRAIGVASIALFAILIPLTTIPAPDYVRAEGVVEPAEMSVVYAGAGGEIRALQVGWAEPVNYGARVLQLENPEPGALLAESEADRLRFETLRRISLGEDPATAQAHADRVSVLDERLARLGDEIDDLTVLAPREGIWSAPDLSGMQGAHVRSGDRLGVIADLGTLTIRLALPQRAAALVIEEGRGRVEVRARGNPDQHTVGALDRSEILPSGQRRLPSAALGYTAGGQLAVDEASGDPTLAASRFFEAIVRLDDGSGFMPGQRMVVRVRLDDRPLFSQWYRALRQSVLGKLGL